MCWFPFEHEFKLLVSVATSIPWDRTMKAIRAIAACSSLMLFCSGCSRETSTASMDERVENVLQRGLTPLLHLPELELGVLVSLRELDELRPSRALKAAILKGKARFADDLYRGLLDSSLPPVPLLSEPGRGHRRLQWYLTHAATKVNPERSRAVLSEFLDLRLFGFGLTHQLYAILWARMVGIASGADFEPRQRELLASLRTEIQALPGFSDLFVEQLNVLLAHVPEEPIPVPWIESILKAQKPDGLFMDSTVWRIEFDGEATESRASEAHTSALSLCVLARWQVARGKRGS